jgi:hypothetical protein
VQGFPGARVRPRRPRRDRARRSPQRRLHRRRRRCAPAACAEAPVQQPRPTPTTSASDSSNGVRRASQSSTDSQRWRGDRRRRERRVWEGVLARSASGGRRIEGDPPPSTQASTQAWRAAAAPPRIPRRPLRDRYPVTTRVGTPASRRGRPSPPRSTRSGPRGCAARSQRSDRARAPGELERVR